MRWYLVLCFSLRKCWNGWCLSTHLLNQTPNDKYYMPITIYLNLLSLSIAFFPSCSVCLSLCLPALTWNFLVVNCCLSDGSCFFHELLFLIITAFRSSCVAYAWLLLYWFGANTGTVNIYSENACVVFCKGTFKLQVIVILLSTWDVAVCITKRKEAGCRVPSHCLEANNITLIVKCIYISKYHIILLFSTAVCSHEK